MTHQWMMAVAPTVRSSASTVPTKVKEASGTATPNLDQLLDKLAAAEQVGRELAHRNPHLLEKKAWVGQVASALGKLAPTALNAGRTVAKTMMRNPTKALAVGGAGAGAIAGGLSNPGYDAQGQQKSRIGGALSGAAVGGALGFGASKIPGAGKMVQDAGKNLSQGIRGHQWQNTGYSRLGGPAATP